MNQKQKQLAQKKHNKLMQLIGGYSLTQEEDEYLRKIKEDTELEIAIRYVKSQQNRNYVFPLTQEEQEDEVDQFPGRVSFEETFYDLGVQNFCLSGKQKIDKLKFSRRVKSLASERSSNNNNLITRSGEKQENVGKLRLPKILSSRTASKSLQKQFHPVPQQKRMRVDHVKSKYPTVDFRRDSRRLQIVLSKKLLTQQQQCFKIGLTKILVSKRIHSPNKAFKKIKKLVTEG